MTSATPLVTGLVQSSLAPDAKTEAIYKLIVIKAPSLVDTTNNGSQLEELVLLAHVLALSSVPDERALARPILHALLSSAATTSATTQHIITMLRTSVQNMYATVYGPRLASYVLTNTADAQDLSRARVTLLSLALAASLKQVPASVTAVNDIKILALIAEFITTLIQTPTLCDSLSMDIRRSVVECVTMFPVLRQRVPPTFIVSLCLSWLTATPFPVAKDQSDWCNTLVLLLTQAWEGNDAVLVQSLQLLFALTADSGVPAVRVSQLSRVLQATPVTMIPQLVVQITQGNVVPDDAFDWGLTRLCTWPLTSKIVEWLKGIFLGLQSARRITLLARLIQRCVRLVLEQAVRPRVESLRRFAVDLTVYMLIGHDHLPTAFHACYALLLELIDVLESPPYARDRHCIIKLARMQMDQFPGHPHIYDRIDTHLTASLAKIPLVLDDRDVVLVSPLSIRHTIASVDAVGRSTIVSQSVHSMLSRDRPAGYPLGLVNEGNTCFKNSVLQLLFHSPSFRESVLSAVRGRATRATTPILSDLQSAFSFQAASSRAANRVQTILQSLSIFHDGHQHDASEFTRIVLDALYEEGKTILPAGSRKTDEASSTVPIPDEVQSLVTQLEQGNTANGLPLQNAFVGVQSQSVTCRECGTRSTRVGRMTDITLAIPEGVTEPGQPPASVASCTASFLAPEHMTKAEDNLYECASDQCRHTKQEAVRELHIHYAPRELMLSLSRFRYDPVARRKVKIQSFVEVPLILDLPITHFAASPTRGIDFVPTEPCRYLLRSVIVHSGHSADHGHYFALVRTTDCELVQQGDGTTTYNVAGASWFECNDATVTPVRDITYALSAKACQRATPYVLVYERCDSRSSEHATPAIHPALMEAVVAANTEAVAQGARIGPDRLLQPR